MLGVETLKHTGNNVMLLLKSESVFMNISSPQLHSVREFPTVTELLFLIIVSRFKMHTILWLSPTVVKVRVWIWDQKLRALEHHALAGMLVDSCPAHLSPHTQHFSMRVDGDASLYPANQVYKTKTFDGVVLRCLQPPPLTADTQGGPAGRR